LPATSSQIKRPRSDRGSAFAAPDINNLLQEERVVKKNLKILVVEDAALQRELCIFQLKELGFEHVVGKNNGVEAFAYLESDPVDLIISDWEMPELNGIELLKKVRSTPPLQHIPFLILTISKDESKSSEAIQAGATDFLTKPLPADRLQEKIRQIFKDG